jgi:hypothetical protein
MANPFGNAASGAGFAADPNLGAGQANSFGAFGPDVELAQINQYNDEITNPLGLRGYDFGTQNTYTPEQLTWLNGQLMAGGNEVSQWDLVNGNPIGSYDTLSDVFGAKNNFNSALSMYRDPESGDMPFDTMQLINDPTYKARMQRMYPQISKLPSTLVDYASIANPYAKDFDTFKWFASDPENRALLYGAYGGVQSNDGEYWGGLSFNDDSGLRRGWSYEDIAGEDAWLGGGKGGRGGMTIQRANDLMKTLPELYPHVAIEDLDRAAYDALQKWSGSHGWDTYHYGMNTNDIIRAIGTELDGLPAGITDQLLNTDKAQAAAGRSRVSAAHAADDADDFGLGDLLGFAGPILSFIPGMQPIGIALNAINAVQSGNPLSMIMAAANLGGMDLGGSLDIGSSGFENSFDTGAMADAVGYSPPAFDPTSISGLKRLLSSPTGELAKGLGSAGVKQALKQAQLEKMMKQLEGDVDVSDLGYEYTPTQAAMPRWAGNRNAA